MAASASKSKAAGTAAPADSSAAVDALMAALAHPHKAAVELLRKVVCEADPRIAEGVKWNAPSFRTGEYFATTHLRAKSGIGLVLHFGAKARALPELQVDDPEGLLTWLAKDRAMVGIASVDELRSRAPALQRILRQWIEYV